MELTSVDSRLTASESLTFGTTESSFDSSVGGEGGRGGEDGAVGLGGEVGTCGGGMGVAEVDMVGKDEGRCKEISQADVVQLAVKCVVSRRWGWNWT